MPKAFHAPDVEWAITVTPTPNDPFGAKDVGEAGTIASSAPIADPVLDALVPLGAGHVEMPVTDEIV